MLGHLLEGRGTDDRWLLTFCNDLALHIGFEINRTLGRRLDVDVEYWRIYWAGKGYLGFGLV